MLLPCLARQRRRRPLRLRLRLRRRPPTPPPRLLLSTPATAALATATSSSSSYYYYYYYHHYYHYNDDDDDDDDDYYYYYDDGDDDIHLNSNLAIRSWCGGWSSCSVAAVQSARHSSEGETAQVHRVGGRSLKGVCMVPGFGNHFPGSQVSFNLGFFCTWAPRLWFEGGFSYVSGGSI